MHAIVPLELSRVGDRVELHRRTRPISRTAGLLTVASGTALMACALAAHYEAAPRGWTLESRPTPDHLLRMGPYRITRNPMYIGEAVVWLGWALFYRRAAVWSGLAILCVAFAKIARWEERRLLERFGYDYHAYLAEVPRWYGGLSRT
jgi:protein-S-isoprenylcysteine O-methyltransferase Ste14